MPPPETQSIGDGGIEASGDEMFGSMDNNQLDEGEESE